MRGVTLSAALALGALSAFTATPAAAVDYPYCIQGRGPGYPGECSYSTYEQCQATASGRNVSCGVNPRFAFGRGRPQRGYDDGVYVPRERGDRRRYRDGYYYDRRY